jgi:hypothetical protein
VIFSKTRGLIVSPLSLLYLSVKEVIVTTAAMATAAIVFKVARDIPADSVAVAAIFPVPAAVGDPSPSNASKRLSSCCPND